jgi:GNAT superfamily N-acetyltransferase
MMGKLVIDTVWTPDDLPYLQRKIKEYNLKHVSQKDADFVDEEFCFKVKDEDGNILGGITGSAKLQCLFIQYLWVDESIRGTGMGKKLLKQAEDYAAEKNCRLIKIDTFSFQAPNFYKSLGYEVYGQIEDFPEGCTHYFLYKKL